MRDPRLRILRGRLDSLRSVLIALNKPYGVLSQFTPEPGSRWTTLASFGLPQKVYPIGRLDADSEGLLLLSDESSLVERILNPKQKLGKEYWVQVERVPDVPALKKLAVGVDLGDYRTLPARAVLLERDPGFPPRDPPVRFRKTVPDCWISLSIEEGKNRQVRRMTAAVGHPTLRLVRVAIGTLRLGELDLEPGAWKELAASERQRLLLPVP